MKPVRKEKYIAYPILFDNNTLPKKHFLMEQGFFPAAPRAILLARNARMEEYQLGEGPGLTNRTLNTMHDTCKNIIKPVAGVYNHVSIITPTST